MKMIIPKKNLVIAAVIGFCLFSGCYPYTFLEESSYYADKNNYIRVSGTVDHVKYSEDYGALYIGLTEVPNGCEESCFKITGNALSVARENGIDEYVVSGTTVTLVTAPKVFGDGFCPPITGLECQGRIIIPDTILEP